jgi:hypothetical protein
VIHPLRDIPKAAGPFHVRIVSVRDRLAGLEPYEHPEYRLRLYAEDVDASDYRSVETYLRWCSQETGKCFAICNETDIVHMYVSGYKDINMVNSPSE